jgi:branched-chain amino acid transport system substrate-binding protein
MTSLTEGSRTNAGKKWRTVMRIDRRTIFGALVAGTALLAAGSAPALADDAKPFAIGVLNDQSSAYADDGGRGSVEAAKMAVEDFGGSVLGRKIDVQAADHQNKPDVASAIARQWFDNDGIGAIFDLANSAAALAVQHLGDEKDKVTVVTTAGSAQLTGKACSPTGAHWVWDTYAVSASVAQLLAAQGVKSWYFLTADYAFGQSMEAEMKRAIDATGTKVLGGVRHPLNANDFSSFLLQAQSSGAQALVLANGGEDTVNAIKQAGEFGITDKMQLVSPLMTIATIHALGAPTAQGLKFASPFYWDLNDETRAWSKRYFERTKKMPTMSQAGVYSAVTHYLKAVDAAKTDEGKAVMAQMRATPIRDAFTQSGHLREDGSMVHDMYLFEVKKPAESTSEWDLYKLVQTIPADQAFMPLADSQCPSLKK